MILIKILNIAFQFLWFIQAQDTLGGIYTFGCKVPASSQNPHPSVTTFCENFECESGYYKLTLDEFTPLDFIPGGNTNGLPLSYVCVTNCGSRGTHYNDLETRTCKSKLY